MTGPSLALDVLMTLISAPWLLTSWVQGDTLETSCPGVFAAGDIVNGGTTVVQAVAEGSRAAGSIDAWLGRN